MSNDGFPTRPVREEFGPEPENIKPVRSPAHEFDGEKHGRLLFHQVSGLGMTADLARLIFNTQTLAIVERWEAWNPKRQTAGPYANPGIINPATGVFEITYPTPIPDHKGDDQPVVLRSGGCNVLVPDSPSVVPWAFRITPLDGFTFSNAVKLYLFKYSAGTFAAATPTGNVELSLR